MTILRPFFGQGVAKAWRRLGAEVLELHQNCPLGAPKLKSDPQKHLPWTPPPPLKKFYNAINCPSSGLCPQITNHGKHQGTVRYNDMSHCRHCLQREMEMMVVT